MGYIITADQNIAILGAGETKQLALENARQSFDIPEECAIYKECTDAVMVEIEEGLCEWHLLEENEEGVLDVALSDDDTKITSISIADFCDEGTTVAVKAEANSVEQEFFVQTTDGEFRSDLGCWVMTTESDGDISEDDYPDFDIDKITEAAENYMRSNTNVEATDEFTAEGRRIHLLTMPSGEEQKVLDNPNYINKHQSSYQERWIHIDSGC